MHRSGDEPPGADLARVVAVSPHFDDAVLSCGHALAAAQHATVVTVFGGRPARYPDATTRWDRECGFRSGDDVVAERRAENARAVKALGAEAEDGGLLDAQYRGPARYRIADVVNVLRSSIERVDPTTVVVPLGIGHRDHRLVCAAALSLRAEPAHRERDWIAYAEYPYAWREENWEVRRLGGVRRNGIRLTPVLGIESSPASKAEALAAYASQLRGLRLLDDVDRVAQAPESLWRISDRPPLPVRAVRRLAYEISRRRAGDEEELPWSE